MCNIHKFPCIFLWPDFCCIYLSSLASYICVLTKYLYMVDQVLLQLLLEQNLDQGIHIFYTIVCLHFLHSNLLHHNCKLQNYFHQHNNHLHAILVQDIHLEDQPNHCKYFLQGLDKKSDFCIIDLLLQKNAILAMKMQ